jgi:hypothetical protein
MNVEVKKTLLFAICISFEKEEKILIIKNVHLQNWKFLVPCSIFILVSAKNVGFSESNQ